MDLDNALLLVCLLLSCLGQASSSIFDQTTKSRCQPIDIPLCQDIPYNMTIFPNPFFPHDQSLQSQADHFKPLIKTKCNPHIQFFICSVFAPMCPDQLPQAVTSCRSVCEEVKRDCIKILHEFDVQWPAPLNCSNFPEGPDLCMRPQEDRSAASVSMFPVKTTHPQVFRTASAHPTCPIDMVDVDPLDRNSTCGFKCGKDFLFPKEAKMFIQKHSFIVAAVSMAVAGFSVLSFLVDIQRFQFPERSIFYISVCQLLYCLPYFARGFLQYNEMACTRLDANDKFVLVHHGLENSVCVVSAFFTYYFGLAGALWWLMLTFTWFLSASRKWVQEEIEKRAAYLHLVSWGLPALSLVGVLMTQRVDAHELTGICGVGFMDLEMHVAAVLAPEAVIVLLGALFAVLGFCSMHKERQCFRRRGTDTSKLDKFITKMTFFTLIFGVILALITAADAYHLQIVSQWHATTVDCKLAKTTSDSACRRPGPPEVLVYSARVLVSLLAGATTCIWLLSPKTVRTWREFICCESCHAPHDKCQSTVLHSSNQNPPVFSDISRIPQRVPPSVPNNQYMPLSVMTSNSNGAVTYSSNPAQWTSSKVL